MRFRAILVGTIVDNLATLVAGTGLFIALAVKSSINFADDVPDDVIEGLSLTPLFLFWSFVLGALCTVLGGYVGARYAGCLYSKHGVFVGLASLLIGLAGYLFPVSGEPTLLWYDLLGVLLVVPCGAVGGWLAQQSVARRAA